MALGALFIPQGGAFKGAEAGVKMLAQDIATFWQQQGEQDKLAVVLPSGTGTTAVFLARHLSPLLPDVKVYAVPCVGDAVYLYQQMKSLDAAAPISPPSSGEPLLPHILAPQQQPQGGKAYQFGQPSPMLWSVYEELREAGLQLDLLYGPRAWQVMFEHWGHAPFTTTHSRVLYIHTGGLEGLPSQLARYRRGLGVAP